MARLNRKTVVINSNLPAATRSNQNMADVERDKGQETSDGSAKAYRTGRRENKICVNRISTVPKISCVLYSYRSAP